MAGPQSQHVFTCAEQIGFLHVLHDVPTQPAKSPIHETLITGTAHTLSFREERRLAGMLAFLAHLDGDVNHIPAVCLQERVDDSSLKLLLAVNKGSHTDGRAELAKLKKGFEGISNILRTVDVRSTSTEDELFSSIVDLCEQRIKLRLRFTNKKRWHDRDRQKMTIRQLLEHAMEYFKSEASPRPDNSDMFLARARNVINLANSWTNHQTSSELRRLIEGITCLYQTDNLEMICSVSIPDPGWRANLLNMIQKVSAYRRIARRLYNSALEFPIVRRMGVEVVELPETAFERPRVSEDYRPSLSAPISPLLRLKQHQKDPEQIRRLLGVKDSFAALQRRYETQVRTALGTAKIHAEIQLLYHCRTALPKDALQPRVLCSSKHACWLCYVFILWDSTVHTPKFHTPGCHGKLYPGWRLPVSNGRGDAMAAKFSQELDNRITESLRLLWLKKGRTNYVGGVESDLSLLTWEFNGSGSLRSRESENSTPEPVFPDPLENFEVLPGRSDKDSAAQIAVKEFNPEESISNEVDKSEHQHSAVTKAGETVDQSDDTASSKLPKEAPEGEGEVIDPVEPEATAESQRELERSHTSVEGIFPINPSNTRITNRVPYKETSKEISLSDLQLCIEYAGTSQQEMQETKHALDHLLCTVEQLSPEDIEHLNNQGRQPILANTLPFEEVSYSLDETKSLYLSLDGAVVRITMQPV
ncbi:hypothetical protein F5Y17DRAFT_427566 [Xylariaceae sp. FL0594]|nr:hypothetical protein F5Y17DRAFT_427566 [Xylariaceae sp. FL0594]